MKTFTRVTGQGMNADTPFEAWNCLITSEILYHIFQYSNKYMLNIKPKLSSERDAKLTDKIEIKAFISLLCLAGALRNNKKSLEEPCGTDGYGIISLSGESQILQVPNPIHSRIHYSLSVKFFTIFFSRSLEYVSQTHAPNHICISGAIDRGSYLSRITDPTGGGCAV